MGAHFVRLCQVLKCHVLRGTGQRDTGQRDTQTRRSEIGGSMAWTAIFFAFVLVPILILAIDGARVIRVKARLQTALDAACEDGAWSAADRDGFRESGSTGFDQSWQVWGAAHTTFQNVLREQAIMHYSPNMRLFPDYANAMLNCDAQAAVPLAVLQQTIHITASSQSAIRFQRR